MTDGKGAMVSNYKISQPLILNKENRWSEWLPRFTRCVQAYGWSNQLVDSTDTDRWPLALDLLLSSIEKVDFTKVEACVNLKDAIEVLKDKYHVSNQVDIIRLMRQLSQLRLEPNEEIHSVVSKVEAVLNNLAAAGAPADNNFKLTHVIQILSQNPAYKATIDHMLVAATDEVTLKSLVRGFNTAHASSVVPGAFTAQGSTDHLSLLQKTLESMREGMAHFAQRSERYQGRGGNNSRGGRWGGYRAGRGGGRGGRSGESRYEEKFEGTCHNCGHKGHKSVKCWKPCKRCGNPNHDVSKCWKKDTGKGGNLSQKGTKYNNKPRANMAQGEMYETVHEADEDYDFLQHASAHTARGVDISAPPGFGGPLSSGLPSREILYGSAMNAGRPGWNHTWILDGGATHHMSPIRETLFNYVPDKEEMRVKVAIDTWVPRAGVGSIHVFTKVNGEVHRRVIKNVWHMPTFDNSLLSANQLKANKFWPVAGRDGDMCEYIFDPEDKLWLVTKFEKGLNVPIWTLEYMKTPTGPKVAHTPVNTTMPSSSVPPLAMFKPFLQHEHAPSVEQKHAPSLLRTNMKPTGMSIPRASFARSNTPMDKETADLWHQRLGHVNMNSLQLLMRKDAIGGINIPVTEFRDSASHPCQVCIMSKHNRAPHMKELPKPTDPMLVASSDIAGPYRIKTLSMMVYIITFVDWCTQHCTVALLQKKSEAFQALQRIIMMHENLLHRKLKYLFSDRGGEYTHGGLNDWFAEKGIVHDFSVATDKQQNGVAERMNQTLNNMVRAMMLQYKSHPPLWGEAMMYAVKIKNCTLNKKLGMTPYEAFNGKIPDVGNFRTFGCLVYARVAEADRGKLDPKSIPGIYLGPELNGPGYRVLVYKPEYKRAMKYAVHVFRDIVCFESLKAVTGTDNHMELHWGGHIPLPSVLTSGPEEVLALEFEPDKEEMTSHHGAGTSSRELTLYERLKAPGIMNSQRDQTNVSQALEIGGSQEIGGSRMKHMVEQPPLRLMNESAVAKVQATEQNMANGPAVGQKVANGPAVVRKELNMANGPAANIPRGGDVEKGASLPNGGYDKKGKGKRQLELLGPIYEGKRTSRQGTGVAIPAQPNLTKGAEENGSRNPTRRMEVSKSRVVPPHSLVDRVMEVGPNGDGRTPRVEGADKGRVPYLNASSSGVIKDSGIKRIGVANVSFGDKRKRDTAFDGGGHISEFRDLIMNMEYDPIIPAAYTASAPFAAPKPELLPCKDELVLGLMRSFEVPEELCGPLPVLTSVDPKNTPKTLKQAMSTKYAKSWAMAVVDEWLSIMANNTWELVEKEPWMKIIPCKWVFVVKVDEKGIPTRFKARLVAGGHRQVEGIDYDETYAPVSRMTTLRMLLSVAANRQWVVLQLDIKTAFLHGKADLDIYMRQPSGFLDGENFVCKLQKTLYGLKQAPRAWYFVLKGVLNEIGFEQMSADSSFWVHQTKDVVVFLTSIVDDMLVTSANESYTKEIVEKILKKLPGTHSGRANYYNGLRITWLDETKSVILTQAAHVEKLYEKFCSFMSEGNKWRQLPAKEGFRVCKTGSNFNPKSHALDVEKYHYRELIGGFVYISHGSRPDAIHTVNQLAKVGNSPTHEHWERAIDLLNFMYNSRFWGIKFGGDDLSSQVTYLTRGFEHGSDTKEPDVVGYADANHGTGIDDKRSISGYVIKILGGPVSWASRSQSITAASTTESEFRALSECSREALWVAKLLSAFNIPCSPFLIRGDSQGALSAIKNYQYTKHTKHIEIVHDFMKDRFQSGQLDFQYIHGEDNPADIFTKCLGGPKFMRFRRMLGMAELPPHLR